MLWPVVQWFQSGTSTVSHIALVSMYETQFFFMETLHKQGAVKREPQAPAK